MSKLLNTKETSAIARKLFIKKYKKEDFPSNYLEKLSSNCDPYHTSKCHFIEFAFCLKNMAPFVLFSVIVDRESGEAQIIEAKDISSLPKLEELDSDNMCLN